MSIFKSDPRLLPGTIKPVGSFEAFLIDPFRGFEMILDTLVIA
jgi:hypothetical protein